MPFIGVQPASALLTSADIQDGQITTAKIADTAVTTAKVTDDAITGAKIENSPTIANGLTLTDGDIALASGHGISFASTSDGTSMTSELLDDYEEGYISAPVVKIGGTVCTVATSGLFYTRIGRKVLVSVEFRITNYNGGSGHVTVDLPYTSATNQYSTGAVRIYTGTVTGTEFSEIQSGATALKFTKNNNGGVTNAMTIDINAYIYTSIFYSVA
tara:strand:+ start:188 stop:832 length:645 start_codon:yes stop_codon:yes gene_type:complete